ncbi:hypothetical protein A3I99_03570 [Candidatus Kaiserbacteria bacterium RIFCSPLOWO2_02_FULL_45_11b]|uniref:Adenylyl/Guanylyl and SMODS C-terminal sensor domain-containing protein n=1 Tax=Candidatus Kaiserbacteria bacterium RIFCSPLOWO2_12_FULL_45_26 TaxID=1798525 RepID=A0A1F6FH32_9BACT|nr:MAG: hypothetical protein A2929_02555 [Candidatus Kaiserbacteria bacterium RIFCSPLOWO2_01_FULL_45_25]OGG83671.1 MAG: hypothetical protein A3I99_03570 [Candidatus Kaiserbacteria bacterium RIFCSPLOWO2_02_FULL_45_11b]OGG85163.1 MAG: hypothetical protein A3G90_03855 [Candidatus Kaiserbacteria bacterium RIFCSPLOWO2_12_FULL_45_26]
MEPVFNDFIHSIKLTKRQRDDAKTKYSGVCRVLHNHYYTDTEYSGKTKLLIGSYGKKTNIRPPGDIDVIFKMPADTYDTYLEKENAQSQLLQDVRGILSKSYTTTEKISAFGKVVVIHFTVGKHNVEVLPGWEQNDGSFIIPNTSNGGSWEHWNPAADITAINASNNESGKTKSLIRLLKKWRVVCGVPLDAFKIEVLVTNHLAYYYNNNVTNIGYDRLLKSFFENLLSIPNSYITTPSGSYAQLGSDWYSRTQSALSRLEKAIKAYEDKDFNECTTELRKIFGDNFPKVEVQKEYLSDTRLSELFKLYPSSEDEFIDKDYSFPIQINPDYSVLIDTRIEEANGFRKGFLLDKLLNSMQFTLPKSASLSFYIKHVDVPQPYSVYWKVRNFGEEAQRKECLRGKITKDEGKYERVESTAYTGIHFVECYIIKNNQCAAIGRIPVPIGS